jgi:carbon monoxide dehydrogenase subunit G
MARYQTTIDVPVAPEVAFAYLADFTNTKAWDPSIVEAERIGDGPIGVGSQFRLVVAFFGKRIELVYGVERHDAPTAVVLAATNKSVESRDAITIEADGAGSRITYDAHLRLKGALRLLDKGLQMQFTTMSERAAAGMKERLSSLVSG